MTEVREKPRPGVARVPLAFATVGEDGGPAMLTDADLFTTEELAQAFKALQSRYGTTPQTQRLMTAIEKSVRQELRALQQQRIDAIHELRQAAQASQPEVMVTAQRIVGTETVVEPVTHIHINTEQPGVEVTVTERVVTRDVVETFDYQPSAPVEVLVERYTRTLGRTPSRYQAVIFDWIEHGGGNAVAEAVAGSGKTTVTVAAFQLVQDRETAFFAFNSHIAKELKNRGVNAKTLHSAGNGALQSHLRSRGVKARDPKDYKLRDICKDMVQRVPGYWQMKPGTQALLGPMLAKIADFTRLTLTNPTDTAALDEMVDHFSIEVPDQQLLQAFYDLLPDVLAQDEDLARQGIIDFTDMIYCPVKWELPLPQLDFIFVDEAQDLNKLQLELVMRMQKPGGRMLFVGDARQSIYGFAGADSDSIPNIVRRTNAVKLPLSVCYRCPTKVLDLARVYCPQIEAREGAPAGEVVHLNASDLPKLVRKGDLILCRRTAPLVSQCMKLIAQKIPAKVRGRDIGKQLVEVVRDVQKMGMFDWEHFGQGLDQYEAVQLARLRNRQGTENKQQALHDKCEAVRICYESYQSASADVLALEIESLFADEQERPPVMLSTVHKAKGLESDRVLLLHTGMGDIALVWPTQQEWEYEQELHITYVAATRAKAYLGFVHTQDDAPKSEDDDEEPASIQPMLL